MNKKTHRKKTSTADRIYYALVAFLSTIAFIMVAYPLYFIIIASFSDSTLVNQGQVLFIPKGISFYGYQQIFQNEQIWNGYKIRYFIRLLGCTEILR